MASSDTLLASKQHAVRTEVVMNVQNILLATDFSSCSGAALQFAQFIAKHCAATLLIAHVISESVYKDVPAELMQEAKARTAVDARAKLGQMRQHTNAASVELLLEEGPVADTLLAISESRHIDLIVAGTRGNRRIQRLLLGSVAEKLSRQARCPVLVVPESAVSYNSKIGMETILCPTNFSERSQAAVKQAWGIAKTFSAHILLMHAVDMPSLDRAKRIERRNAIEERMKSMRALLSSEEAGPEVEFVVEFGPIVRTIARVAAERGASLVVLSIQRGKPALAHLPPEITYSVAQLVSCPVLTIAG